MCPNHDAGGLPALPLHGKPRTAASEESIGETRTDVEAMPPKPQIPNPKAQTPKS